MKRKMVFVMMAAALLAAPAMATVVFSDDFSDGDRNGWYLTSGGLLSVIDDSAGIGTGNAMQMLMNSGSTQRRIVANFAAVQLQNIGDSLSLSFDFRIIGTGSTAVGGFRFGLFNSRETLQTVDATSGTSSANAYDDQGYFGRLSAGTSNEARLSEDNASGTSFMGGTDLTDHAVNASFGGINNTLKHTAVLTITRVASTNTEGNPLDIPVLSLLVDGTSYIDDPDGDRASPRWTFDEIGLAGANRTCDFVVDNVNVVFTPIPEPATLSILALGAIAAVWKRKRS